MGTATLIGSTAWVEIPGGSETPSDDGGLEVVRRYNGSLSTWVAFRNSMPIGSSDPTYGSALLSVTLPDLTSKRKATGIATITFSGGVFSPGQDKTPPGVNIKLVNRTIYDVPHPVSGAAVELTYGAWQTTVTYKQKSTPGKTGSFSRLADTTAPIFTAPAVEQKLQDEDRALTTAEIAAAVQADPSAPLLIAMDQTRSSAEGGNQMWDVSETWITLLVLI